MGGGSVGLISFNLMMASILTLNYICFLFFIIKAWHKSTCFNCKECRKRLESTTLCEREGEIYCKSNSQFYKFILI